MAHTSNGDGSGRDSTPTTSRWRGAKVLVALPILTLGAFIVAGRLSHPGDAARGGPGGQSGRRVDAALPARPGAVGARCYPEFVTHSGAGAAPGHDAQPEEPPADPVERTARRVLELVRSEPTG